MMQDFIQISYDLDILDEIVLKMITHHAGIVRGNLIELLARDHGITKQDAIDRILLLTAMGIIKNTHSSLKISPRARLEDGKAHLGRVI